MRHLATWMVLAVGTAGCVGPISDWPSKNSDENGGHGSGQSATGGAGASPGTAAPARVADAGAAGPGLGTTPGSTGSSVGAGTTGGSTGIGTTGSTGGSGDAGLAGGSVDAGSGAPSSSDGSGPALDAATPDAGALEGGASDAGDASLGEAGRSDGGPNATCNAAPDAGGARSCTAYGCATSLDALTARVRDGGVCGAPEALALACDGVLERAAAACTQESALGLGVGRAVSACVRRIPELARVPGDCMQCYADEALCTLSRCFVACIDGRDPSCAQCRRQSCGEPFSKCSGLPPF